LIIRCLWEGDENRNIAKKNEQRLKRIVFLSTAAIFRETTPTNCPVRYSKAGKTVPETNTGEQVEYTKVLREQY